MIFDAYTMRSSKGAKADQQHGTTQQECQLNAV
jgi:hypothetical protein